VLVLILGSRVVIDDLVSRDYTCTCSYTISIHCITPIVLPNKIAFLYNTGRVDSTGVYHFQNMSGSADPSQHPKLSATPGSHRHARLIHGFHVP
jgi:hypothetical protein